ncbi:SDR family oxidoreductase [Candidatus Curtissbacteria bacterium]|nr:SDR family oxidoreductase [Candidatus Curtissbacteria bacterium]
MQENLRVLEKESLKDKIVLITGGSGGIGAVIVAQLLAEGANVIILDKNPNHPKFEVNPDQFFDFVEFDLQNVDQITRVVASILEKHGRVDVLVNNAALPGAGNTIEDVFTVDLVSPLKLIDQLVPIMTKQGGGRIINVSSIIGVLHQLSNEDSQKYFKALEGDSPDVSTLKSLCPNTEYAYAVAKRALIEISRKMVREVAKDGITINCVAPGYIATEGNRANIENPEIFDEAMKQIPIQRPGEPEEVADLIVYLCQSPPFLTGTTILIDGGQSTYYQNPLEGKHSLLNL